MRDENTMNRMATDEELLLYMKNNLGIKTLLDIRIQEVRDNTFKYSLIPSRWAEYDNFLNLKEEDWKECKYFDADGNITEDIQRIPNNKGGIYIYVVKPPIPIPHTSIITYIGRAHNNGTSQNLRKRVNSYAYEADDVYKGRRNIRLFFSRYKAYLHVMYVALENNEDIDRLEKELISAMVPMYNKDLIQKSLKEGRAAF